MLINTPGAEAYEEGRPVRKKHSTNSKRSSAIYDPLSVHLDRSHWGRLRIWLDETLSTQLCESALGILIVSNVIFIIVEADVNAECADNSIDDVHCYRVWLVIGSNSFLIMYTIEALIRFFVYRFHVLKSKWFIFDLFIVGLGYVDLGLSQTGGATLPAMQMMRIFRVARLMRGIRLLRSIPELYSMIRGFTSAMNSMFWGFLMIILLLMLFAIFAVELIHPVAISIFDEDDWCREAFSSVSRSVLYFFQTLVAGDSWGACSIPVVKQSPLTFFIYAGALVCVQLGFTNLILAVIVEKAASAHEEDVAKGIRDREKQKELAAAMVNEVCESIDADGSGRVTLPELMNGYDTEYRLREALLMLDIQRSDLGDLFQLMDNDGSGDLTYEEVTNCIHKADTQDIRRQIMFVKLHASRLESMLKKVLELCARQVHTIGQSIEPSPAPASKQLLRESSNDMLSCNGHHVTITAANQTLEHTLECYMQRIDEMLAVFIQQVAEKTRGSVHPMSATANVDFTVTPLCGASGKPKSHKDFHQLSRVASDSQIRTMPETNGSPRLVIWESPQAQWGTSLGDEADPCQGQLTNVSVPSKLVNQSAKP